ncbi:MAG: hypothetical protein AAGC60_07850 [Acidobacteriota bacterium]
MLILGVSTPAEARSSEHQELVEQAVQGLEKTDEFVRPDGSRVERYLRPDGRKVDVITLENGGLAILEDGKPGASTFERFRFGRRLGGETLPAAASNDYSRLSQMLSPELDLEVGVETVEWLAGSRASALELSEVLELDPPQVLEVSKQHLTIKNEAGRSLKRAVYQASWAAKSVRQPPPGIETIGEIFSADDVLGGELRDYELIAALRIEVSLAFGARAISYPAAALHVVLDGEARILILDTIAGEAISTVQQDPVLPLRGNPVGVGANGSRADWAPTSEGGSHAAPPHTGPLCCVANTRSISIPDAAAFSNAGHSTGVHFAGVQWGMRCTCQESCSQTITAWAANRDCVDTGTVSNLLYWHKMSESSDGELNFKNGANVDGAVGKAGFICGQRSCLLGLCFLTVSVEVGGDSPAGSTVTFNPGNSDWNYKRQATLACPPCTLQLQ